MPSNESLIPSILVVLRLSFRYIGYENAIFDLFVYLNL
jgi:hypothetical protein